MLPSIYSYMVMVPLLDTGGNDIAGFGTYKQIGVFIRMLPHKHIGVHYIRMLDAQREAMAITTHHSLLQKDTSYNKSIQR